MKIVVVGGGKVGEVICQELSTEENDIVLIDKNQDLIDRLLNKFDIMGICGNGASYDILVEAGVENCDIFISVTEMDEINIIASILAKKIGAEYTVARVRNPEYSQQLQLVRESLGISLLINPELSTARDIANNFNYPSALSVENFVGNRVSLLELEINEGSALAGLTLKEVRNRFESILICVIHRDDQSFIPDGDSTLEEGDHVFITGAYPDLRNFLKLTGQETKSVSSATIVGGGRITYYLLNMLKQTKINTKVIEVNEERCETLSYAFPHSTIIHADGTDHDVLEEQRITEYDVFVSMTGIDEENLILSAYAKQQGVPKIITKMSRPALLKVFKGFDNQSIVTPKRIVANEIIQFVRSRSNTQGSNVEALYRLADNQVEALQFRVQKNSAICGIPLSELKTKSNLLIAFIVRGEQLIYPAGSDTIEPFDKVIVVTTEKDFDDINDILE